MKVGVDNTFLTLIMNPDSDSPQDPGTGAPVPNIKHRIEALLHELSVAKATVIIPAPALAEMLSAIENPTELVAQIEGFAAFEICEFCSHCAVELALMNKAHSEGGNKRGPAEGPWQMVKFDKQIVATARANGATVLYTDDDNQTAFAKEAGLKVVHTWELPLPEPFNQGELPHVGPE